MSIHYNWVNWINDWDFLWKHTQNFEFLSIFVIFSYISSFSPPIWGPSNLWGHQGGHLWCSGASPNHTPTTISQPAQSETTAMIGNTPISQYDFNYLKLAKVIILQWIYRVYTCKQGRIHGNPVADGWAGAIMQKPLAILEIFRTDGWMDRPTRQGVESRVRD